ncbi:MAG TPA: GDSL-type esterase/lipase family protein [Verrucomicrobiae bacterium]|jgi:lysophospholipase L1-like esterase
MKFQKLLFIGLALAMLPQFSSFAQTNAPATADAMMSATTNSPNAAIIPVSRTGAALKRQTLVLKRAHDNPGDYDIEFIGDSITQFWETFGSNVWSQYYSHRKVINMGVSGDLTQHVLWRFDHGQLDGIKAKVAVVMIGTNNTKTNAFTEAQILEGVTAIVQQVRTRQPDTKILLFAIFPRGQTFNGQRAELLQVNEALARLDDGSHIFYYDIGPQMIENDGSISRAMMPDYLHPRQMGYEIWAAAMEPKIKQLLGEN